jgi:hypothetical protein
VTYNLSSQEFDTLISEFNLVPIYKTIPLGADNPVGIFEKLALNIPGSFLLEYGHAIHLLVCKIVGR